MDPSVSIFMDKTSFQTVEEHLLETLDCMSFAEMCDLVGISKLEIDQEGYSYEEIRSLAFDALERQHDREYVSHLQDIYEDYEF